MNPFTPEQRSAIDDRDHNLIVVAGAGSGKTRVLVERYLALLEHYEAWPLNAIVAITFTRK
ncbi:MAG TPA: UvrD-helicase domain-containing protein, partial [Aggregatilineales bacterium]|nr:UvrD-helicase domain-containing protein [Aggregatilineales bacterium]